MKEVREQQQQQGLYRSEFEHDNCGIGAVVNIKGKKTHDTVANALKIVEHLEHRAGKDAEGKTGDGVGILLQISHKFFKKACKKEGFEIGDEREYGIAQFFFPQHEIKRAQAKKMFEIILEKEGLELLGWRQVPVFPEVLGHKARECMPCIMQAFIKKPEDVEKGLPFDRMLYIARREFEQSNDNTYVVYAYYQTEYKNISTKVPSLTTYYVIRDAKTGNVYIHNKWSDEIKDYISKVSKDADVQKLISDVQKELLEAEKSDANLKKFLDALTGKTEETTTAAQKATQATTQPATAKQEQKTTQATKQAATTKPTVTQKATTAKPTEAPTTTAEARIK